MATKKLEVLITGDAKSALLALGQTKGGLSGLAGQLKTLPGFAATVGVAVGAAAVAAGVGLFKLGQDFDDAYDKIRVGTGATGKDLEGLKGSFKNTFAAVPTDMGSAATAIADLNTRLGLTGKPLERLAAQVLELSRLTGEDLSTVIESTSRVFGDWSIPTGKQSKALDELFRTSQLTGIGVGRLSEQVVQFGAPLRALGFGFEESIALLGKWEKEGVNADAVLAGLKQGIGGLVIPSGDLKRVLGEMPDLAAAFNATPDTAGRFQVIKEKIAELLATGDKADAMKALELGIAAFGKRAANDLVKGMEEGRFSVDDLMKSIKNGKDTIRGAAKDTNDFGETWNILKNKVLVALEPIATKVFAAISRGMEAIIPVIEEFRRQWPEIQRALEPVMAVLSFVFENLLARGKAALDGIMGAIKLFGAIISGDWSAAWDAIKQIFGAAWDSIMAILSPILEVFKAAFQGAKDVVVGVWQSLKGGIESAWGAVSGFISGLPGQVLGFFTSLPDRLFGIGKNVIKGFWDGLKDVWRDVKSWVKNAVDDVVDAFTSGFGIFSPSRVMAGVGRNVIAGLGVGMEDELPSINVVAGSTVDAVTAPFGGAAGASGSTAGGAPLYLSVRVDPINGRVMVDQITEYESTNGPVYQRVR